MQSDEEDTRTYDVVVNGEEQYSIWLHGKPIPAGWAAVGKSGPKTECLAYVDTVWTDMRPLSLRKHMEAFAAQQAGQKAAESAAAPVAESAPIAVTAEGAPERRDPSGTGGPSERAPTSASERDEASKVA